jgi:integrase
MKQNQHRKRKTSLYAANASLYEEAVDAKINPKKKTYPEGTKFNNWILFYENEKQKDGKLKACARIRRWVIYPDGTKDYERFPAKEWAEYKSNPKELQNFVMRANGLDPNAVRARRKYELKEAYVGKELMNDYIRELRNEIPKYKKVKDHIHLLEKYFLGFFVQKLGFAEPLEWHRHQDFWGLALINLPNDPKKDDFDKHFKEEWRLFNPGETRSPKTLKGIVQAGNRFMRFLHKRRPKEIPPLEFDPLKSARLKTIQANRVRDGKATIRYNIPDKDWAVIEKACPISIKRYILIIKRYGLRRAESMAIQKGNFLKNKLEVKQQLIALPEPTKPVYDILKGKDLRSVPHSWFSNSKDIKEIMSLESTPMHPDTFTKIWEELMNKLGFPYSIHCIRHTWTTKAVRVPGVHPRDVQQAAGHKHLTTTMGYIQRDDARDDDDQPFFDDED